MNQPSPCVGTCKLDLATGWCLGCARSGEEIADWSGRSDASRSEVWNLLPARFAEMGAACRVLPWGTEDIREFVASSLTKVSGTWVLGVVGAVAEFVPKPREEVEVTRVGADITALTDGGALRFSIDASVRAITFDPPGASLDDQRVVLAVNRERGRPPTASTVTALGADDFAISASSREEQLFDLGLGRKESRFCVRCRSDSAQAAMAQAAGARLLEVLPKIGPSLVQESPVRVVESALGRIEISTPIPPPQASTPPGPHTHLLPDHLATGRALPVGMDLPRAYLPGAIFYPSKRG